VDGPITFTPLTVCFGKAAEVDDFGLIAQLTHGIGHEVVRGNAAHQDYQDQEQCKSADDYCFVEVIPDGLKEAFHD
jgi:hypothetical protein